MTSTHTAPVHPCIALSACTGTGNGLGGAQGPVGGTTNTHTHMPVWTSPLTHKHTSLPRHIHAK